MKKKDIINEYRLRLDNIFEDAHSYTGPNIDETFDRVWELFQEAIYEAEKRGYQKGLKEAGTKILDEVIKQLK